MELNRVFGSDNSNNKSETLFSNNIKEEEDEAKLDPKYKTELCQKYENTGKCPYGSKCRFAHGKEELIIKQQNINYKKKPCKSFWERGYCNYGSRCCFIHNEKTFLNISFSYYYLRLFLYKFTFFLDEFIKYNPDTKMKFTKRLPVFEEITKK